MRTFRTRLLVSYIVVAAAVAGIVFGTTRLLAPGFFRVNIEQAVAESPDGQASTSVASTVSLPGGATAPSSVAPPGGEDPGPGTSGPAGPTSVPVTPPTASSSSTTDGATTSSTGRPSTSSTAGATTSSTGAGTTSSTGGATTSTTGGGTTSSTGGSGAGGPTTTHRTTTTQPGGGGGNGGSGSPPEASVAPGPWSMASEALVAPGPASPGLFAAPGPSTTQVVIPGDQVNEAFLSAIDTALVLALAAGALFSAIFAALMARRLVRPIAAIGSTTQALASGRFSERVEIPTDAELAVLAHDVNALAEVLEQSESRRARLIADVAHEVRTPISTIQGYMEGLLDGVVEPGEEVFALVADEASRLQRFTDDLGLLSRLDEATLQLDRRHIDLREVIRSVADRLLPQFVDQSVTLNVDMAVGLPVEGDRDRLVQVFTNLVGNALGHTAPGGRVEVRTDRDVDHVRVTVVDDGEGIASEDLPYVFDRFYRASTTRRPGTGIGLTIARSLVRRHGGEIVAESAGVGAGARFTVRLPAAGPSSLVQAPGSDSPALKAARTSEASGSSATT